MQNQNNFNYCKVKLLKTKLVILILYLFDKKDTIKIQTLLEIVNKQQTPVRLYIKSAWLNAPPYVIECNSLFGWYHGIEFSLYDQPASNQFLVACLNVFSDHIYNNDICHCVCHYRAIIAIAYSLMWIMFYWPNRATAYYNIDSLHRVRLILLQTKPTY